MVSDPERLLDWSNYLYGAAALLTLVATFGVIYFGRVVAQLKDSQVKAYQKQADEKIAEANMRAAAARVEAAKASAQAAEAKERTVKEEKALAETRAHLVDTQLQLAKLKTPRTLSKEQQQRMVAALKAFPNKRFVLYTSSEAEAVSLMRTISQTLVASAWAQVRPQTGLLVGGNAGPISGLTGIEIFVASAQVSELSAAAEALAVSLAKERIEARVGVSDSYKPLDAIHILIGSKPI